MISHEFEQATRAIREMEAARARALRTAQACDRDGHDMLEIRQLCRDMPDSPAGMRDFVERVRRIALVGTGSRFVSVDRGTPSLQERRDALRGIGMETPEARR